MKRASRRPMHSRWRSLAATFAIGAAMLPCAALAAAFVPPGDAYLPGSLDDRIDRIVRDGHDRPAQARAQLAELRATLPDTPAMQRLTLQAQAIVDAQAGRASEAAAGAERLLTLSRTHRDPLAEAAAQLVRAQVASTAGQIDTAAALAQSAAHLLRPGCAPRPAAAAGSAQTEPPCCDYRSLWRALRLMQRRATSLGHLVLAREQMQEALDLADAAGDVYRKALTLGTLAYLAATQGQADEAERTIAQARRMAASLDDPAALARVRLNEARVADAHGDVEGGLRATEAARRLAERAGARRLEALLLGNLSDSYVRRNRPADALRAAMQALPTVREFNDLRAERVLINNAGLAKIGLGRIAEGKQDFARVMAMWEQNGAVADQAITLREFGEALAGAGDEKAALELYHRERRLSNELMQHNRSVVLKEMQTRYDSEARQRSLDLLNRDRELTAAALANRELMQRVWLAAAAFAAVAAAAAVLLYRRMRGAQRRLQASHARLRVQSERDPLTDLANRRHFHAVMNAAQAGDEGAGFDGALLMVDIDHFKHINDNHGHGAGDVVLVEVAQRLNSVVRGDDLVVRWGGEEFLILAGKLGTEQADQLAARVLASIGGVPILAEGQSLWVTASIGYACFPLPPYGVPVPWEQAINLADMALYTAKSLGRNRAVGLASASASDAQSLRAVEDDFERAWREGRVTLRQTPGPGSA